MDELPDEWNKKERKYFYNLYDFFRQNQEVLTHPKAKVIDHDDWLIIAWNTAWIATDNYRKEV